MLQILIACEDSWYHERMNGYEERKKRTSSAILQSAIELFTANGIADTSVAEIAGRAGVNPVSIFNRFGNKRNLVRATILCIAERQWEASRAVLEGGGTFMERLERLIAYKQEETVRNNPELFTAALNSDPDLAAELNEIFTRKINSAVYAFLEQGRKEGAIRQDASPEVMIAYLEMFFDMAKKHPHLFDGRERSVRTTKEIWGLVLDGLRGSNGSR